MSRASLAGVQLAIEAHTGPKRVEAQPPEQALAHCRTNCSKFKVV